MINATKIERSLLKLLYYRIYAIILFDKEIVITVMEFYELSYLFNIYKICMLFVLS